MYIFLYLAQFFSEWEMFQTKFVEKIKNTHFVFRNSFLIVRLRVKVEKYCKAGQATDGNIAYAHCMLDT
jgi:hypothetical protein